MATSGDATATPKPIRIAAPTARGTRVRIKANVDFSFSEVVVVAHHADAFSACRDAGIYRRGADAQENCLAVFR